LRGILYSAAGVGLAAGLALLAPEALPWDRAWTAGLAGGALLGTAGSLGGFWLLLRNLRAGHARFLAAFFGGMLARWALFGGMVAVVLVGRAAPASAFLAGLVPSYLGFQAMEMWYLHRQGSAPSPAGPGESAA